MEIAVVGGPEFILGFQLCGIHKCFEVNENPKQSIKQVFDDKEIGIIIIDQKTIDSLDEMTREDIEKSVNPVAIILSEQESQEALRKMIKKSIGIDLWKE